MGFRGGGQIDPSRPPSVSWFSSTSAGITVKPVREERDQRGSHIFSYTWDKVGGGFPHNNKAVNLSGKILKGFPADSAKG